MQAVFVDLPNFYSHFLESKIEEPRALRDYFLEWFDFDRLAYELTDNYSPVWVFHSDRRFGPRQNRIEGKYLKSFISRSNSLKGVTARNVNIPGEQREPASYECEKCGHSGIAQWESEKGIDASLTVHLFDTMESWENAFLLSGDADFVPAVSSLRRRGKIVIGAGFSNASAALVRECYDYIDLTDFLRRDFAAYQIFKQEGILQKWLLNKVDRLSGENNTDKQITLTGGWRFDSGYRFGPNATQHKVTDESQTVFLTATGPIDLSLRHQLILDFQRKFPNCVKDVNSPNGEYKLSLDIKTWEGVRRRLDRVRSTLSHLKEFKPSTGGFGYQSEYL